MKKDTALIQLGREHGDSPAPVNPPVMRASTILFPTIEAYEDAGAKKHTGILRYGRHGTSTAFALQDAMAQFEGGYRSCILPSGLAAIAVALVAFAKPGSHLLVCDTVYGPTRAFCDGYLRSIGVEVTYFPADIGAGIAGLIRPDSCAVYCEAPGSCTFEMQDIPAISKAAHAAGIPLLHDNTWATPYFFDSFSKGVDVSIHAATKYIVGHSDAMLGVVVCSEATWQTVRNVIGTFGYSASADDCYLALRGLRTLGLRLQRHQESALKVATWLEGHELVERVLHPGLRSDPGHAIWKRDFTGASGLFGFVLKTSDRDVATAFANSLRHFGIGSSWGGYESLVTLPQPARTIASAAGSGALVRLHVGLEDPDDLIQDLERGLHLIGSSASRSAAE